MKNRSNKFVPGNWLKVDFHVHTPSSYDFVGIGKDEGGYLWVLEQAVKASLDLVVITDHNDVSGYFKFKDIEEDLFRTKRTLERTKSDVPQKISEQLSLFEKVVLLPGVELDIYPNIHVIIVFDPQRDGEISDYLTKSGYSPEVRGDETSSKYGKWNLDDVLIESEKIGALVIAAHVDSDKGLYEVSKKWGQKRILAFCNDNLCGMEFINPVSKDQIESILKSPDYKRNSRLAFVQSSDFHGKPDQRMGDRKTYVRMDNCNKNDKGQVFQLLKKAFKNPDEFISAPGRPELNEILRKLDKKLFIETLSNETHKELLINYICAYSNTENGTILIGRNEKKNWVGQKEKNAQEFIEKIKFIISSSIKPTPIFEIQVYPYYDNHFIATINIKKHIKICSTSKDEKVFIFRMGKLTQATISEIIELIENRFIERYSHLSITNKISDMSQKMLLLEDSIDILSIVRRIENSTVPLTQFVESFQFANIISDSEFEKIIVEANGLIDGDVIVISPSTKPRQDKAYLRLSAPIGKLELAEGELFDGKHNFSGEKIIIAPGGGVFFDTHNEIYVVSKLFSPIVLFDDNKNFNCSLKFLTAYLKSSICIWYADRCLGSFDLRIPSILRKLPIPISIDKNFQNEVEEIVDEIIIQENIFLQNEQEIIQDYKNKEDMNEGLVKTLRENTKNHNDAVNKLMGNIDYKFYEFFGLTIKEIIMIEQHLKSSGFANFNDNILIE